MRMFAAAMALFLIGCVEQVESPEAPLDTLPDTPIEGVWSVTRLGLLGYGAVEDDYTSISLDIRPTGVADLTLIEAGDTVIETADVVDVDGQHFRLVSWLMDLDCTVVGDEGDCIDSGQTTWDYDEPDYPIGSLRLRR